MHKGTSEPRGCHSLLLATLGLMAGSTVTLVMEAERTPFNDRARKTGLPGVYQPLLIMTQSKVICLVKFLVINSK